MDRLRGTHQELDAHFRSVLFNAPGGAIHRYLIDHAINEQGLASLRELLRHSLLSIPLTSFHWETAYLPVLICAVEVGYHYEGNGSDFWPKLSEVLGYACGSEERQQVSEWFARASDDYVAVRPGDSQWEQAFRHIAWPIAHAVASKDIRRPFADCLRRFRADVRSDAISDDAIVSDLSLIPTSIGSRRFRTWLGRPAIVAGIVRDLLGGQQLDEAGLFSKTFRDRLISDLHREPEIRRAVRQAAFERAKKPRVQAGKREKRTDAIVSPGSLFLCRDDYGKFELWGEMPESPTSVRKSLQSVRGRWKIRPWGLPGASPIPADCLRSNRGQFPVRFRHAAKVEPHVAFFTGVDEQHVGEEAKQWLSSVRFPTAPMLAFLPMRAGDDSSHSICERMPRQGKIWVLSRRGEIEKKRSENDNSYCHEIGQIEDGEIHEFEADDPKVREWLGWPETSLAAKNAVKCFTWITPSPISIDSTGCPWFAADDEIGVSVAGDSPVTLILREGTREVAREAVSAVAISAIGRKGNYSLTVAQTDREAEVFRFGIVNDRESQFIEPAPVPPWQVSVSHVDAGVTELSRNDLFNRRLNLDVVGERSIDHLTAKLSIAPGDAVAYVQLERIPIRVAGSHQVWEQLLESLPTTILKSPCDLSLTVEIEGLTCDSWRLEAELQQLWWEEGRMGLPSAVSDSAAFSVRHYCIVEDKLVDSPENGEPLLSVAFDSDGNQCNFDTRVSLLGDASLGRSLNPPKRFLRQMDGIDDNPGLRRIAQRYLQLSTASSSSLTAEINRVGAVNTLRCWVVRSLCGSNWYYRHQEILPVESAHPLIVWWECQLYENDLLQPPGEEAYQLPGILSESMIGRFANVLPEHWWDGSSTEMDADDTVPLDSIYQGLIEDDSVIVDSESLSRSLRLASERLCGAALADLIIPANGGDELLGWNVSNMAISDLASELHAWIRRHLGRGRGRQNWTADELSCYLNFLLYPERLRKDPWEAILEKLLQDRSVARAGAFISWRVQQSVRLASMTVRTESATL